MSTQAKRVGRPRKDISRGEAISLLNIPRVLEQQCINAANGEAIEVLLPCLMALRMTATHDDLMSARERWQGEERRKVRVDRGVVRRMLYESDGRASWLAVVLLERWLAQAQ